MVAITATSAGRVFSAESASDGENVTDAEKPSNDVVGIVAKPFQPAGRTDEEPEQPVSQEIEANRRAKQVIGAVSPVEETLSDIRFVARVDTGATTCSMHVEEWHIDDAAESMSENVGKSIRFRIKNRGGKSEWLERKVAEVATIKTSEREEQRYKVYMTLVCSDVAKRVLVSLNDRSHMAYPVLIGRNFLEGDFLVDVSLGN